MASAASHVIPSEGLRKFRLYYFVRTWGKDVMFRVFSCCFLEGSSKTIREILEDNGISFGKKSFFTAQEINKISNDPPESFDITAMNKICRILWDKGVNCPGNKVKDLMKKIKDERNNVSHEECDISQSELGIKLQDFGSTLQEVLDEAAVIYPCHGTEANQLKIDIGEAIPKIQEKIREKYDPSNPDDCKRLQDEIEEFGDQLRQYILDKSVVELMPLYIDLCKILPFDWLCQYGIIDPCNIMVSLRMDTNKEFYGNQQQCHTFLTLDQNEILDKKDLKGMDPKVVVISGGAGAGKTVLLCSMVEKWHKKETDDIPTLSSYQTLLYMQFRNHDYDNFDDYLRDLLQHVVVDFGFDLVKSSVLRSKCLILCDGYDERNDSSSKLFGQILGLKCTNLKIIVTTRPVNTKELTRIVNKSKREKINLTVLGLQTEDMKELVTRITSYLVQDQTERDKMIIEINGVFKLLAPEMKQILKNPLQFNLFILLYIECPYLRGSINSATKLFIELQKHYSKRLMDKLDIDDDEAVSDYEKLYREWSLKYYFQAKYELTEKDVNVFKEACRNLGVSFESVMSTYFNIKHSRKGTDLVKTYCYRHRTEQEFAAAGAICDVIVELYEKKRSELLQLKKEGKNIINHALSSAGYVVETQEDANQKERLTGILRFVTGILYNTEEDLLFLVINDILDMINVKESQPLNLDETLPHLLETNNNNEVSEAVARKISTTWGEERPQLVLTDSKILSCLPSVLPRMNPAMLKISLEWPDNPEDFPALITAIEFSDRNDIELHLKLPFRTRLGISSHSDGYLEKAKKCVAFSGSLSEDGIRLIPTCIKDIFVQLDLKTLECLSKRLPSLPELRSLAINVYDDGSVDPDHVSPVDFSKGNFTVTFNLEMDLDENARIERTAKTLKAFWPRKSEEFSYVAAFLKSETKLTEAGAELLLEALEVIKPLRCIIIPDVIDLTMERYEELKTFCRSKELGNFYLSKKDPDNN